RVDRIKYDGYRRRRRPSRDCRIRATGSDDYGHLLAYQLNRQHLQLIVFAFGPAIFDGHVPPLDIAGFVQATFECHHEWRERFGRSTVEETYHRHRRLLRPRRERPRRRRATEQRDELAAFHSITSSARASSDGDTSRPSAFAVLRLSTSSNLVGCRTGRSAGFSPFRIRPV